MECGRDMNSHARVIFNKERECNPEHFNTWIHRKCNKNFNPFILDDQNKWWRNTRNCSFFFSFCLHNHWKYFVKEQQIKMSVNSSFLFSFLLTLTKYLYTWLGCAKMFAQYYDQLMKLNIFSFLHIFFIWEGTLVYHRQPYFF